MTQSPRSTAPNSPAQHEHQHDHRHQHAHGEPGARVVERRCDVAVIGGSAAGLAAALQLARQRRTVIVVDDGAPRNATAAHMHSVLGHEGRPPGELLATGRGEVCSYGGEVLTGRALAVHRSADDGNEGRGFVVELSGGHRLIARRVLVASGVSDELPAVPGLAERWGREVFACPFCHGFEVRDQRVVQLVTHPMNLHPTPLLHHLTDRLTLVLHEPAGVDPTALAALESAGIPVLRTRAVRAETGPDGAVTGLELSDGRTVAADAVLVGTRFRARAEAIAPTGLTTVPHPSGLGDVVEVDSFGATTVSGIYAAGTLTDPSQQVLPAAAHGSRVGAMIASELAQQDLADGQRRRGEPADWDHRYGGEQPMWSANPNGTLVAEASALDPGRALDVGAGEGADALWLAERGWRVTATDVSARALERVGAEAGRRGLDVRRRCGDINDPEALDGEVYDLVSLQYGSFLRTPDQRGLRTLLGAVAPGGTLLVVSHDLTPLLEPVDPATQTRMFDPGAYVGVDEIAAALEGSDDWSVEVHATRPRPAGAVSTHHVDDVVLKARRNSPAAD